MKYAPFHLNASTAGVPTLPGRTRSIPRQPPSLLRGVRHAKAQHKQRLCQITVCAQPNGRGAGQYTNAVVWPDRLAGLPSFAIGLHVAIVFTVAVCTPDASPHMAQFSMPASNDGKGWWSGKDHHQVNWTSIAHK
jgi:hypothetical protein